MRDRVLTDRHRDSFTQAFKTARIDAPNQIAIVGMPDIDFPHNLYRVEASGFYSISRWVRLDLGFRRALLSRAKLSRGRGYRPHRSDQIWGHVQQCCSSGE
jgi:hypothetical protein